VKDGTTRADFLRQTPTLAGRVEFTERFGWRGEDATLEAHLIRTVRRLEGTGITDTDRDDLAAYVRSLRGTVRAPRALTSLQSKGRDLFRSAELGCNSCHTDLGASGGNMAIIREGGPLRSPSLRSVSRTPPYFHDGSEETLEEVLELKVKALELTLSPVQSEALVAYLETL
jgi:cytochrome c peroxidase